VRRTFATLAAGASLLAACAGTPDDDVLSAEPEETAEPEPTETEDPDEAEPEPEETEEPEPADAYAVPDEIDEAYVEDVINAILEVQDEVLRGALEQEQGTNLSPELMELHFATTSGAERTNGMDELQRFIDDARNAENLRPPAEMGASRFDLEMLVHAEAERCILAVGNWDISQLVVDAPPPDDFTAFSLSRIDDEENTSAGNPTPWQWRDSTQMADGEGAIPQEEWPDLDFGAALDHSCEEL
jgi:hypothetical protein